ncbi:fatty acid synthase-like, partial [Anoplophora glabripennis]|uniref:fatty acid synthase-like n=1 Tax=Anoplophora glabripennis TaxID=217634 RepID=UPI000874FAE8
MSEIDPVIARDEYYIRGGRSFASPLLGEEIVISGMAAVFPNCSDIYEFKKKLFNKVNMVASNRKWDFHSEISSCSGTISEINRFDCGFFGIHERQSHSLDAMARIFQEKAIEAIFDAGLHPTELQGTKTGVYVGVCSSENDKAWYFDNLNPQTFAVTGSERSMIAHRLSYFLKLKGPSTILDTACSSSCYALENAYRAIRLGEIDNAIVAGTNLCLYSNTTMQFLRLGLLSDDGFCKAFDSQGNGYARAEGVAVVILQKAKDAKRIYTQLVHVKTNCDGFKEQGITFPSGESQTELLIDMFEECEVDKFSLSFVEAHGTGTKAGDPEECTALDNVLTSGRKNPLPIGSVKSNIGHTEPASGLCSIIKCVLAMETGYIPPNIHFDAPGDAMMGLVEGRLKVVTEKTPLEDKDALMGVNNFGFGGANAYVLLKRNSKTKTKPKDNLPRLVCVSGRTVEAILVLLGRIETSKMDVEYIGLLHEVFA